MSAICNISNLTNIRYIVWKKDNTLLMVTENINDIFAIDKNDIKIITKENKYDRTNTSELYYDTQNKTPEEIIEKYDKLYSIKLDLIEPIHLNDNDKKIIHHFNSTSTSANSNNNEN